MAEVMLAEMEREQADLAREVQEASKVPLPTGDSSSTTSEGGSEVLRLRELEMEEKRAILELEVKKLEAEERKAAREAEAAHRKAVLEAEESKAAREAEERRAEREAKWEAEQADRDARMKLEQAKLDYEIRVLELKARQTQPGEDEEDDGHTPSEPRGLGNLALQTKRFGDTMRHVLPKMPHERAELELPQFFETVEKLYAMYAVPGVVQAKLLIPLIRLKR